MEKPVELQQKQPRLGEMPSLRTLAAEQKVKNINTLENFEEAAAKIPADLRCELVKALIKLKAYKFSREQLLTLIDQHCSGNLALTAYTYYMKTHPYEIMQVKSLMDKLRIISKEAQERNDEIGHQVALALEKSKPLSEALKNKKAEVTEFFLAMGLKPVTADLVEAIKNNDMILAERLINSGVPVEDRYGSN